MFGVGAIEMVILAVIALIMLGSLFAGVWAVVYLIQKSAGAGESAGSRSTLLPCPDCGRRVSPQATTCPQCGRPLNAHQTQPEA